MRARTASSPERPSTAALACSAKSSITRPDTSTRSSARLRTCLYSDGGATPARAATAARVSAPGPDSSTISMARSTTALADSGDLPMHTLLEEGQDGVGDLVGILRLRIVAGALDHDHLPDPVGHAGDDAVRLGARVAPVGVVGAHHD